MRAHYETNPTILLFSVRWWVGRRMRGHEGGLPENVEILKQRGWHKESQHERQAQTSVPKFAAVGSKLHVAQFALDPSEGGIVADTLYAENNVC